MGDTASGHLEGSYPLYLAGRAHRPNLDLEVTDKYTGEVATRVALAGAAELEEAIAKASAARRPMAELPRFERMAMLRHCADRFEQRAAELAGVLAVEAGKPLKDSKGEVKRLVDTFRMAADVIPHVGGEQLPLDISPRALGYRGMTRRVPVGACAFITPFNFPLNLVAHKVAPALAAGCPFVLKPSTKTPVGALLVGEVLAELELPEGAFSILPMHASDAGPLVEDDRLQLLSFTGSDKVGWELKARAGKKRVQLELGGNAAVVVDEGADLADACGRITTGAFYQAGQSCIGVQRIYGHSSLYEEMKAELCRRAGELVVGDPREEGTDVGPLIDDGAAQRLAEWVDSAVSGGARLLCGGTPDGRLMPPTLLEEVPADHPLVREEAFGPVAVLASFDDYAQALAAVDDSRFGLQAGVFTPRLDHALKAWDELEVGAVLINEIPSWRVDHMPYGGVKDSGLGREGLKYAMEEMTEPRLLVLREPDKAR